MPHMQFILRTLLVCLLVLGTCGWLLIFAHQHEVTTFFAELSSERGRNYLAIAQSVAVILGIGISIYLFVDGKLKRDIDRDHLNTSLLTISSTGVLLPNGDNKSIVIEICFENVGTSTVKLWDIELVRITRLDACTSEQAARTIEEKIRDSTGQLLSHWRLPHFGIRAKEKYYQQIAFTSDVPIGACMVHFRVFFDHAGTIYDVSKPFDIERQDPTKKQRPWFSEANVLVKSA